FVALLGVRSRPKCAAANCISIRSPSAMASNRSGTSSTLAVLKLTRTCSKNRRHDFLEAGGDLRRRAFLYHHCAGHARADQDAGWHVRDVDPDRNALRQSHLGECGIDGREELWTCCLLRRQREASLHSWPRASPAERLGRSERRSRAHKLWVRLAPPHRDRPHVVAGVPTHVRRDGGGRLG